MLLQAAGFALLATVSPTSLLVMAVFLGSANPRATAMVYAIGAVLMTATMAVVLLIVIRVTGLNEPRQHDPRYGLRLGLGVLALAAAAFMAWRKRPQPDPERKKKSFMDRLVAQPSPRTAFIAGLLLFAPGVSFIAAVQVIATANSGVPATIAALVVVVVITLLVVWLPLVAYLAAPDATTRRLRTLNDGLRTHGRTIAVGALIIAGGVLVVDGSLGLGGVF
jgi:Sap, sulfolipid-1-addressing protein